ncbi:MAG: hypothetical protein C0421_05655 [Hyphomonas sp.]|uniref:hypothetical protein n=1 Tax=Hyphomonas sp. TaxID=87 RepID=UPI0025C0D3B7|nr:hypothetical protein [Hyphomonas sp.]MBA4338312.1 hypothetical protein [Hyphomonas sp.]
MTDVLGERRLWPRGLPCPDLKAISFTPDGGELATEMESGTRRNRQLYETLPTTYKATMTCDRIETVIFMSFYKEVAGAEFEIDVHSPFALVPSLTRHRAQFLSLPDVTEAGAATWKVSMTLWLAEVTVPDFDTLAFLAAYGSESGAMINRFDVLANDELADHMGAA